MDKKINISKLIDKNPIIRLSKIYENKMINKIKNTFTNTQQKLFASSFYCYINYDTIKDFVIDFDNVWKWLGYSRKDPAKRSLEKNFVIDIDYKIFYKKEKNDFIIVDDYLDSNKDTEYCLEIEAAMSVDKAPPPKCGGAPPNCGEPSPGGFSPPPKCESLPLEGEPPTKKEYILLSATTFKKFCIKSNTHKSDEIHDYYIKLEQLLQETINEQSDELKNQLNEKKNELINLKEKTICLDEEIQQLKKKYIKPQKQSFDAKNVVYLITSEEGEKLKEYCVGKATNLENRQNDYNNNKLHNFKVIYYKSCENSKLMDNMESCILNLMGNYRCKAGRDVFKLPENSDITLFTNIFDNLFKLYEGCTSNIVYPTRTIIKEDEANAKERHKKYAEEHKEELKEKHGIFYQDNREVLSVIKKEYNAKNADKIAVKNKKNYKKNKEKIIEQSTIYYNDNKEKILVKRKESYIDKKDEILVKRKKYQDKNYKDKIAPQRSKKEKCECGMIISHYCIKKHRKSKRHIDLMASKINLDKETLAPGAIHEEVPNN